MPRPPLVLLPILVASLAVVACGGPSGAPSGADMPSPAPSADTAPVTDRPGSSAADLPLPPPPPLAEGAEILYACGSTEMHVVYKGGEALVMLIDGRVLPLRRTPDAEERYAGEHLVLLRLGNVVELSEDGGEPLRCEETGGTA